MNLRAKILTFVIVLFLSLISVSILGLQVLSQASETDNIARINQLMKSTVNIVQQFELLEKDGALTRSDAQKFATKMLRENKYHDSEYVYVVNKEKGKTGITSTLGKYYKLRAFNAFIVWALAGVLAFVIPFTARFLFILLFVFEFFIKKYYKKKLKKEAELE